MLNFIIEYWVNFLLGAIALGITAYFKYQYSTLQKMKTVYDEQEKEDYLSEVYKKIKATEEEINKKIDTLEDGIQDLIGMIKGVHEGLNAVQYNMLYDLCMTALKHQQITERDFINIQQLYTSYNEDNADYGMKEIYKAVINLPVVEQYEE